MFGSITFAIHQISLWNLAHMALKKAFSEKVLAILIQKREIYHEIIDFAGSDAKTQQVPMATALLYDWPWLSE